MFTSTLSLTQFRPVVYTADEVLSPYISVFYVAFIVSFALHADHADGRDVLRDHRPARTASGRCTASPVAYLGGVAVFLGWICGLAVSQLPQAAPHRAGLADAQPDRQVQHRPLAAMVIVVLGLWDDILTHQPVE